MTPYQDSIWRKPQGPAVSLGPVLHLEGVLMLVVRPIAMSDYESLHTCAVESGHGFTSLPVNEELLTNRIKHSEYSFGYWLVVRKVCYLS